TTRRSRPRPVAILFTSFWIVARRSGRACEPPLVSLRYVSMAARSVGLSVMRVDVRTSSSSPFCWRLRTVRWCWASVAARSDFVCRRISTVRSRNERHTATAVSRTLKATSLAPRLGLRLATFPRLRERDHEVEARGLPRLDADRLRQEPRALVPGDHLVFPRWDP